MSPIFDLGDIKFYPITNPVYFQSTLVDPGKGDGVIWVTKCETKKEENRAKQS